MIFQYTLRTESGMQVVDVEGRIVVYDRYSLAEAARNLPRVLFVHRTREPDSPRSLQQIVNGDVDLMPIPHGHRLIVATHGIDWSRTLQPLSEAQPVAVTSEAPKDNPVTAKATTITTPASPLNNVCPVCDAAVGVLCRSRTTGKPTPPHKARQSQPRAPERATRKAA